MTLGRLLRELLGDRKQGEVAAEWLTRWRARGAKEISQDHVESSLSRCINERVEGVRFFFADRARAALLLDVLQTPGAAREPVLAAADQILAQSGDRLPRIVIDVSPWDGERSAVERLFVAVEESLLAALPGVPIAVVMTESQFRWLPRTFDDRPGLALSRLQPSDSAAQRVSDLAGEGALVISNRRFDPFDRWAALDYGEGGIRISPADAVSDFSRDGRLSRLPDVVHDLAAIDNVREDTKVVPPAHGVALREMMVALSLPSDANRLGKAGVRLALARAIGVVATATDDEVREATIAQTVASLGLRCDTSKDAPDNLRKLLDRATRRAVHPAAFRVEDEIHVVAPIGSCDGVSRHLPHVRWHDVEPRVPALERLSRALAELTDEDLLDDPWLEQTVERLDPSGADRLPLAHARAILLFAGKTAAQSSPPERAWRSMIDAFSSGRCPRASLLASCPDLILVPERVAARAQYGDLGDLAIVPPARRALVIRRSDNIVAFQVDSRFKDAAATLKDIDLWQDQLDSWLRTHEYHVAEPQRRPWDTRDSHPSFLAPLPAVTPDRSPVGRSWGEIDRLLGGILLGFRRALCADEAMEMDDGAVLLHLGAGVCAEIRTRKHERAPVDAIAAFGTEVTLGSRGYSSSNSKDLVWSPICSHVTTSGAAGSNHEPGYELPTRLYLSGHGFAADVSFTFAPWLGGSTTNPLPRAAAVRAIADAEEAAARAADDDD